jgi:myosin heavy subunit
MLNGLSSSELSNLQLANDPSKYFYLGHSECGKVDTIDDAADFKLVQKSFTSFGFAEKDRGSLWRILAGILHLGNVNVVDAKQSGPMKVQFTNEAGK